MNTIERMIRSENRMIRKRRNRKYKLLRKFRQARDLVTKYTHSKYTCNFLRKQISNQAEFDWFASNSKNELARAIYRWSERERDPYRR